MKWYIPVKYEVAGFAWVYADSLEDAMSQEYLPNTTVDDIYDDYPIPKTCVPNLDEYTLDEIGQFDGNVQNKSYPELINYDSDNSWEPTIYDYDAAYALSVNVSNIPDSKYRVSFMAGGCVYRCTVRARNQLEAIGVFSRFNPRVPGCIVTGIELVE